MLEAKCNYGPLKKGHDYDTVDTRYPLGDDPGVDWYLVRVKGKSIYVPKWVFENGVH